MRRGARGNCGKINKFIFLNHLEMLNIYNLILSFNSKIQKKPRLEIKMRVGLTIELFSWC